MVYVVDEPGLAEGVTAALEREGFEVATVTDPGDALDHLETGQVDCVLSGHGPAVDGLALLERVRETYPDLPFVLFPADGSEELASRAVAAGVTEYVPASGEPEGYGRLVDRLADAVGAFDPHKRERLLEATGNLQTAETREEVAGTAVEHVEDVLGLPAGVCWFYDPESDRLEPVAATDPAREADLVSALSADDDGYEAFLEGVVTRATLDEGAIVDEATAEETTGETSTVDAGTALLLPLGDHGLVAAAGDRGVPEGLVDAGRTLAEHVTLALTRVERTRAVRERERHLRVTAEHIDEAIYLVPPDYSEVLYVNPAFEEIWGRPVEELYENPLSYLEGIDPRDREEVRAGTEMIMEDLERGEFGKRYWVEFRVRQPSGEVRWVYSTGQTVELPDGETRFIASAKDITERKRHEQRLEVFNRVLRHNLRNQLDVVRSHAEELRDRDGGEHTREILATVDALAAMGDRARTIDRFMSRDVRETTVDLAGTVRETVGTVDRPDAGVEVTVDLPGEAPLVTDRGALEAVLESALENALEYADSAVAVGVEDTPHGYTVTVADDGPGIPREELAALDAGTETDFRHGRGLGLWQLKWGVEKLNGEFSFDTGDGTTVRVAVPDLGA